MATPVLSDMWWWFTSKSWWLINPVRAIWIPFWQRDLRVINLKPMSNLKKSTWIKFWNLSVLFEYSKIFNSIKWNNQTLCKVNVTNSNWNGSLLRSIWLLSKLNENNTVKIEWTAVFKILWTYSRSMSSVHYLCLLFSIYSEQWCVHYYDGNLVTMMVEIMGFEDNRVEWQQEALK